ncbi:MAG TPA: hypothetical protein QGF70_04215, partial [Candidatus Thalassarchaeaceae archaeon]|nr:hypothetical protein [Candidatus Thalassarchaeaceae archaeon]
MRGSALALILIITSASISGCIWNNKESIEEPILNEDNFREFTVVAPIDTGINVYHDHFRVN